MKLPTFRMVYLAFMAIAVIAIIGLSIAIDLAPVDKEAARKAQDQADERDKLSAQKDAEEMHACQQVGICFKYSQARQECATAGDFNNCLSVKLGDGYRQSYLNCSDQGRPYEWPTTPTYAECLLSHPTTLFHF